MQTTTNSPARTLANAISEIIERGPTRVVVTSECYATTPDIALADYGIVPEVVFLRADGWSLGAPKRYAAIARRLWKKDWIAEFQV